MPNTLKEIEVPIWWIYSGMMYRREYLPFDHPEHTYNYIKRTYGINPEDYGIFKPINCKIKEAAQIVTNKLHAHDKDIPIEVKIAIQNLLKELDELEEVYIGEKEE